MLRWVIVLVLAVIGCNQISGVFEYHKEEDSGPDSDSDSDGDGDGDGDSDTDMQSICKLPCAIAMLGDGNCDDACKNMDCGFDDGDCYNEFCVDGCIINDIGDGVCNAPCNVATCGFDLGDCNISNSGCTPGCEDWMIGDGDCQYQCLGNGCGNDDGDCDDKIECAPGCGNAMLGDSFCHPECNNMECFNDNGDCAGNVQGCDPGATSCLDDCVPCARQSTCSKAVQICENNTDCVALRDCLEVDCAVHTLGQIRDRCMAECYNTYASGEYDYNEAELCLYCHACPVSCESEFDLFCSENGY